MLPHLTKLGRVLVNIIWSLIYSYRNALQEYSLWIVNSINIYLLFNSDIVNFVLKTNGVAEGGMGVEVQKALFCYFCFLGCSSCWWVNCGGVGQKVLFRTGWNHMFLFIQGCESEFKISLCDFSLRLTFFLGGWGGEVANWSFYDL